jgi:NAD(P)-dependent dehydrogenase (short-subunit alcohol dehydrogenase family)
MTSTRKTAIVTGASQGIGAGIVKAFVERGFRVVANSLMLTQSTEVAASDRVAPTLRSLNDRSWLSPLMD